MDTATVTSINGADVILLGIYVRISDDDKDPVTGELTREGVSRQEADCRKLADDLSIRWGVQVIIVRVYDDNNITAADERVTRPDFEQLLKDLESKVLQGFLFYHSDRVARLDYDATRVNRLYRLNPKLVGLAVTGGVDLSTDEGRAMFTMQAVMGGMEVASTRRRVTRRNRDAALDGKNHGGKRPFGWEPDRKTLRQWEADLLAKAIRDIAKGKTIGQVRKEWIAAGVTATAEGKGPLRDHTVLSRVTSPRACGWRRYQSAEDRRDNVTPWLPELVLYKDGEPVVGDWTPAVTPEDWQACVAVLEARREKRASHDFSRNHAKYLLSGIARCGECGGKLYGKAPQGTEATFKYVCPEREGGCGGIKRTGPPLDKLVEALFLKAVEGDVGAAEHEDIDDTVYDARVRELEGEKKEVMARRRPDNPRRISTSVAMDLVAELEAEINDLRYKSRQLTARKARRMQDAPSLIREWASYTIDMKRDRLRRDIRAVVVNRTRRGARFDPACIEIDWTAEAA